MSWPTAWALKKQHQPVRKGDQPELGNPEKYAHACGFELSMDYHIA